MRITYTGEWDNKPAMFIETFVYDNANARILLSINGQLARWSNVPLFFQEPDLQTRFSQCIQAENASGALAILYEMRLAWRASHVNQQTIEFLLRFIAHTNEQAVNLMAVDNTTSPATATNPNAFGQQMARNNRRNSASLEPVTEPGHDPSSRNIRRRSV